jgi:hypothetical protein
MYREQCEHFVLAVVRCTKSRDGAFTARTSHTNHTKCLLSGDKRLEIRSNVITNFSIDHKGDVLRTVPTYRKHQLSLDDSYIPLLQYPKWARTQSTLHTYPIDQQSVRLIRTTVAGPIASFTETLKLPRRPKHAGSFAHNPFLPLRTPKATLLPQSRGAASRATLRQRT